MSERTKLALAVASLLILFASGSGVGIAVDRMWLVPRLRNNPPWALHRGPLEVMTQQFTERLSLDEAQAAAVREAMKDALAKVWALRVERAPQIEAITVEARRRILAVLNETQRAEFDRMNEEHSPLRGKFRPRHFDRGFYPGFRPRPFRGPNTPPTISTVDP